MDNNFKEELIQNLEHIEQLREEIKNTFSSIRSDARHHLSYMCLDDYEYIMDRFKEGEISAKETVDLLSKDGIFLDLSEHER